MENWWQWASEHTAGWPSKEEVPQGVRLNLGCGRVILPNDEGWLNIDSQPLDGVDQVVNLFEFPWPIAENSADYIIASHLIEHIPHQVRIRGTWVEEGYDHHLGTAWMQMYDTGPHPLDGFFAFFAEAWRVLKPNGVITCIAPYGATDMAFQDPTHTRYIVPETFTYLMPSVDSPYDYGLPFRYEFARNLMVFPTMALKDLAEQVIQHHMTHSWNAGHTIRADLRALKGIDSENRIAVD